MVKARLLVASVLFATAVQLPAAHAGWFGPVFPAPWNSARNKSTLETAIKKSWKLQVTGAPIAVSSASCKATSKQNIWTCSMRYLGNPKPVVYRIEVDPDSGNIAGRPI